MQTTGFTPPDRAVPDVCHTVRTDFGHGGCTFRYPNPAVAMRTFQSDRRHLRCRHVDDPMTDNAHVSGFRDIQHRHYQNVGRADEAPPWPAECTICTVTFH